MTLSSFFDLVAFTTATTGTGTITVDSAVAGARTPATAGIADGTTVSYAIKDGSNYEAGVGVTGSSGTTLTRTVLSSSNSNTAISLSGSATVSYAALSQDLNPGTQQLARIVTSGSQATVDFTSINPDFRQLNIVYNTSDTHSGTSVQNLYVKVNNDGTSGDYTSTLVIASANGAGDVSYRSPTTSGMWAGLHPQAGTTSSTASANLIIADYSQTTVFKNLLGPFSCFTTSGGIFVGTLSGTWKSTAAINRLTFSTDGTAFLDGSAITLYGMK